MIVAIIMKYITIIVILLTVISSISFILGNNTPYSVFAQKQTTSTSLDNNDGSKTYFNKKDGFQITYPANASLVDLHDGGIYSSHVILYPLNDVSISITVSKAPKSKTLEDIKNDDLQNMQRFVLGGYASGNNYPIKINNNMTDAIRIDYTNPDIGTLSSESVKVLALKDKKIYDISMVIRFYNYTPDVIQTLKITEGKKLFDQILNSFKFTS